MSKIDLVAEKTHSIKGVENILSLRFYVERDF